MGVRPWGLSACSILPFTVWRSFHLTFQIYWFFVAWVGTTVFWLPRFYKKEPESQSALIELLAAGCAIVAVGGMVGIPLDRWAFLMVGRHTTSAARAGSSWNSAAFGRIFCSLASASGFWSSSEACRTSSHGRTCGPPRHGSSMVVR